MTAAQVAACVLVAAAAGWLYHKGSGLRPVAAATWLAPLPPLVLAPRVPWPAAVTVAAAAWLAGQAALWTYLTRDIRLPRTPVVALLAAGCVGFGAAVALARAHLVDGRVALAALALPVAWAAIEFLVALRSPHGAWWSVAYTQADVPAVTRIAALAGPFGVTAALALPAGVTAALTAPAGSGRERPVVLLAAAALTAGLAAYSVRRARRAVGDETVHIGLAAAGPPGLPVPIGSPEGAELVARYVERVRQLASRGAAVIVLPEAVFTVEEGELAKRLRPFADAAAELGVTVVLGAGRVDGPSPANLAVVFGADGDPPSLYAKHHLVPGLEAAYRPGRDLLYLPSDPRAGVIICKDLDFPRLARAYRRGGARLLLAPAWDFVRDGWLHSRMAVVRGVESGVAVARVARDGRATVSDATGRIVIEADAVGDAVVDATVRLGGAPTLYSRLGDWFGWCCCVAAAALVAVALV